MFGMRFWVRGRVLWPDAARMFYFHTQLTVRPFFVLIQRRFVEWEDFADHAMVHNPKGGTAVLPKMIIEKAKMDGFTHTKNKNGGQLKKK
jgi:hypothetical protein